jgi:hypothetical protein
LGLPQKSGGASFHSSPPAFQILWDYYILKENEELLAMAEFPDRDKEASFYLLARGIVLPVGTLNF